MLLNANSLVPEGKVLLLSGLAWGLAPEHLFGHCEKGCYIKWSTMHQIPLVLVLHVPEVRRAFQKGSTIEKVLSQVATYLSSENHGEVRRISPGDIKVWADV